MNKLLSFLIFSLVFSFFSNCETSNEPQAQSRAWGLFIILNKSSSTATSTSTGTTTGTATGPGPGQQPPPPPPSVRPEQPMQNADAEHH